MSEVIITVGNEFIPTVREYFRCAEVDMSDLESLNSLAAECCEVFLSMHHDIYNAKLLDVDRDTLEEAFYYTIEEVATNDTNCV